MIYQGQAYSSPQEALAHHGVKGMKWGVRNEDETGSGNSSSAKTPSRSGTRRAVPSGSVRKAAAPEPPKFNVKKAEKHEANAARAQRSIERLNSAPPARTSYLQEQRRNQTVELTRYRDSQAKAAKDVREGHLTDGQKKALIGLAVAGGVLAAYGAYKYTDSGGFHAAKIGLAERASGNPFSFKKNLALKNAKGEADIFESVVKGINPEYGAPGTKMNCRRCTFAYELRRRGYDVAATKSRAATGQTPAGLFRALNPEENMRTGRPSTISRIVRESLKDGEEGGPFMKFISNSPFGSDKIATTADFATSSATERSSRIFSALAKHPEGARGELGVSWTMGGGHSMAWEIVGGKPVIFDTQTRRTYNSVQAFEEFAGSVKEAGYTRLDNKTLNEKFLRRWVDNNVTK